MEYEQVLLSLAGEEPALGCLNFPCHLSSLAIL